MREDLIPGEVAPIVAWLHRQALEGVDAGIILEGLCARLLAGGLDLERAVVAFLVFHPQFDGIDFSWARDTGRAERQTVTRADIVRVAPSPFSYPGFPRYLGFQLTSRTDSAMEISGIAVGE